jgi:hypothetical protein
MYNDDELDYGEVTSCWGDPDTVYYTIAGSDEVYEADFRDCGNVFGLWDGELLYDKYDEEIGTLMHDEFLIYYIYYYGWPKLDIKPSKEVDDGAWDYDVACNTPVEYESEYDDEEEERITYGQLIDQIGDQDQNCRGRFLNHYNYDTNRWEGFVCFWNEPTKEIANMVRREMGGGGCYYVMFTNQEEADEYFKNHKIPTLNDYIQGKVEIPEEPVDRSEQLALHMQKANDKWNNTGSFRATRDKAIYAPREKAVGTMAAYHNMIHSESKEKIGRIIREEIIKYIKNDYTFK